MSVDEIFAKLVTVEKLLMMVCSDPRYSSLLSLTRNDIQEEYGAELNRLFPSDPHYGALNAVVSNFNAVANQIDLNHQFQLLK